MGIICALPQELGTLVSEMEGEVSVVEAGGRQYYRGLLWGRGVVIAAGHIGKVAAAITTTHMIERRG